MADATGSGRTLKMACEDVKKGLHSCYEHVEWAMNVGVRDHPEFYNKFPAILDEARKRDFKDEFADFQCLLHHKEGHADGVTWDCPLPCNSELCKKPKNQGGLGPNPPPAAPAKAHFKLASAQPNFKEEAVTRQGKLASSLGTLPVIGIVVVVLAVVGALVYFFFVSSKKNKTRGLKDKKKKRAVAKKEENLENLYDKIDADGDGKITRAEFDFYQLDKNHDGQITQAEFDAANAPRVPQMITTASPYPVSGSMISYPGQSSMIAYPSVQAYAPVPTFSQPMSVAQPYQYAQNGYR